MNNQFGELVIEGLLQEGKLNRLRNTTNGMEIKTDPNESLVALVVEKEGDKKTVKLFRGADGIEIVFAWTANTADSVSCRVKVKNTNPAYTVRKIIFTLPAYIDLGGYGKDFLVYPRVAGIKIENPAEELFKNVKREYAKWKDRTLGVTIEGLGFCEESGETVDLNYAHSSNPSMMWLDYFSSAGGIYLASHDPGFEHTVFHVSARKKLKGLMFRIEKIFNRSLSEWDGEFIIGLHSGDWHRGADIYRLFHKKLGTKPIRPPDYIRKAPGMVAHYDFKWQNGDVNHHFKDMPEMFREARGSGFTSLLIAGWNINGFDNNYPRFRPDPELGTEQELIEGIREIHRLGGKVFFYNNAYSFDMDCEDYENSGKDWAVKQSDGKTIDAKWGSSVLSGMCNSAAGWRAKVKNNIRYLIEQAGADGVYIDQLSVAPRLCFDRNHRHKKSWILNNVSLIKEVREELGTEYKDKIFLFSEWLTDALLPVLDAQLIHTCWGAGIKYAFPEMFRYTFPTAFLVDLVLQKPWPGNPHEIEEKHVRDIIGKLFVNGIFFWTFDHVISNPRIKDFFIKAVKLKTKFAGFFAAGAFEDDTVFREIPLNIYAKSFLTDTGQRLVAVYNKTGKECILKMKAPFTGRMVVCDSESRVMRKSAVGKIAELPCPADPFSVITFE